MTALDVLRDLVTNLSRDDKPRKEAIDRAKAYLAANPIDWSDGIRCTLRAGHGGDHLHDPAADAGGECGALTRPAGLPTAREFHEHLVSLVMEAWDRVHANSLSDLVADGAPTRRARFEAEARERSAQAAQVYAIALDAAGQR